MIQNSWKHLKQVVRFLQIQDWMWSIPIAITGFVLYGYFQEWFFGSPFYDTQYIHKSILTGIILMIANGFIMGFMWFNNRVIFKQHYRKNNDFKNTQPWLKVLLYPLFYFLELLAFIAIFKAI